MSLSAAQTWMLITFFQDLLLLSWKRTLMDYLPWRTSQVLPCQTTFQSFQISATPIFLIYLRNHCRSLKTQSRMRWKAVTLWIPLQQEGTFHLGLTRLTRSDGDSQLPNWYQGCSSPKGRIPSPWSWGSRCLPVWLPGTDMCPTLSLPTQIVSTQQYWLCAGRCAIAKLVKCYSCANTQYIFSKRCTSTVRTAH